MINQNGKRLIELMENQGLIAVSASNECQGKWTYMEKKGKSIIDYILIQKSMAKLVQTVKVEENRRGSSKQAGGESDHNAVWMEVKIKGKGRE